MIRVLITQIILFLLPFVLYAAYLFLTRKIHKKAWIDAPRYWLVLAGIVFCLVGFITMSVVNNNPLSGTYVPAHFDGDKVVPGQIKSGQ